MWDGQTRHSEYVEVRTILWNQFSPTFRWVQGLELSSELFLPALFFSLEFWRNPWGQRDSPVYSPVVCPVLPSLFNSINTFFHSQTFKHLLYRADHSFYIPSGAFEIHVKSASTQSNKQSHTASFRS